MKLTTRCGSAAVDGLNETLLAKAAKAKPPRTTRLRADTTAVPANVSHPTDSSLLAKAMRGDRVDGTADPGCRWRHPHPGAGPVPFGTEVVRGWAVARARCSARLALASSRCVLARNGRRAR
jgi:hypothetical protein